MSSFWWNYNHWLHWKLLKWQLPVQPEMKISSKWRHFCFSDVVLPELDFHYKDEMFVRPSYVYNENLNTDKKALFITSIITPNHSPDYHRTSIISKALPHKLRWYCNKPFSQWQHSCHFESYVTIAYNVCIASQIFSKTGSYQSRQAYIN